MQQGEQRSALCSYMYSGRFMLSGPMLAGKRRSQGGSRAMVCVLALATSLFCGCSAQQEETPGGRPRQKISVREANKQLGPFAADSRRLVQQVDSLGGRIRLDLDLSLIDLTDDDLAKIELPDTLTKLNLSFTKITDDGLAVLASAKNLAELELIGTQITEAGVEHLKAIPKLRRVNLHATKVPRKARLSLNKFLNQRPDTTPVPKRLR